jgi:hypothetical protein
LFRRWGKKVHIEETHFVQTPFILSNFPRFNLKWKPSRTIIV